MSDKRTSRHERDGRSSDEHLLDQDKQRERQTETDDSQREGEYGAKTPTASPSERGVHGRVDEASDESFPASDPPQQP